MKRRHTGIVRRWLIVAGPDRDEARRAVRSLPPGCGVLVLSSCWQDRRLRLAVRRAGEAKCIQVVVEGARTAVRVHDIRELRSALLKRTPLILLSPIYPTASHLDWSPMPRMRAAAFARLADRRLIALGGMNERRFNRVKRLGFQGWAGISAWLRT